MKGGGVHGGVPYIYIYEVNWLLDDGSLIQGP